MGLDGNAMMRLKKRRIESGAETTTLYQQISTMKEFGLTPAQWSKLTRLDKKVLHYHRAAESFYIDMAQSKLSKPKTEQPRLSGANRYR